MKQRKQYTIHPYPVASHDVLGSLKKMVKSHSGATVIALLKVGRSLNSAAE
jgi:hypothetical protein